MPRVGVSAGALLVLLVLDLYGRKWPADARERRFVTSVDVFLGVGA